MTVTIDIPGIKAKIIERLKLSGWSEKLRAFVNSGDFDHILQELVARRESGERFTPVLKLVFRAFEECPYNKLKIVIVNDKPYSQLGVSDGIAFSCSNMKELQPVLARILEEVHRTVYPESTYTYDPDLARWANQGILLLNTSLTTPVGKQGSHADIWKPFISYVIDIINTTTSRLIWVFMGKEAQEWNELIGQQHYLVNLPHPSTADKNKRWDTTDCFNQMNDTLSRNSKDQIVW